MNLGKESETVEFKKSTSELKEGIISLASMLNKSNKATLYFGVKNDGEVVGFQIGEGTERKISEAISNSIEPSIIPTITTKTAEDGKEYIEIEAKGTDTPYSAYGYYYVRSADEDRKATRESLKKMFTASGFDFIKEMEASNQNLHFTQFISKMISFGFHLSNEKAFLKNKKFLTSDGCYNQMAELLSDESNASIKVVQFAGKDKTAISKRTEYGKKCMILAMQQVLDYIESINETNVVIKTGQREEEHLFDFHSFREAWINACLHNSWDELIPPAVYIFADRIEVISYGGLPLGLSIDDFYAGDSHPKNMALLDIFCDLDYAEQSGHGIPVIVDKYGREAFKISDNFVVVTLKFSFTPQWAYAISKKETLNELNKTQLKVFESIKENPRATAIELSQKIGMSEKTVKNATGILTKKGLIKRNGSRRDGFWEVK